MIEAGALARTGALALALVGGAPLADAAGPADLAAAPPGALSCSGCHAATAPAGSGPPPIHGRRADELVAALAAFRSGERAATVMNRIAPGFTEAESRAIAEWLSRQERGR